MRLHNVRGGRGGPLPGSAERKKPLRKKHARAPWGLARAPGCPGEQTFVRARPARDTPGRKNPPLWPWRHARAAAAAGIVRCCCQPPGAYGNMLHMACSSLAAAAAAIRRAAVRTVVLEKPVSLSFPLQTYPWSARPGVAVRAPSRPAMTTERGRRRPSARIILCGTCLVPGAALELVSMHDMHEWPASTPWSSAVHAPLWYVRSLPTAPRHTCARVLPPLSPWISIVALSDASYGVTGPQRRLGSYAQK